MRTNLDPITIIIAIGVFVGSYLGMESRVKKHEEARTKAEVELIAQKVRASEADIIQDMFKAFRNAAENLKKINTIHVVTIAELNAAYTRAITALNAAHKRNKKDEDTTYEKSRANAAAEVYKATEALRKLSDQIRKVLEGLKNSSH